VVHKAVGKTGPNERIVFAVTRTQVTELAMELTLGRRPLNMINPSDEIVLKREFADWWREQGGEFTASLASTTGWPMFPVSIAPPEVTLLP
jgi:hypothetical protein